jgi:serine protease Do
MLNKDEANLKGLKGNKIAAILLINFLISIFGGIFGSYAYLDYRSEITGSSTLTGQKNVKVEESSAIIDAVEKASPSVVSITGTIESTGFFGNIVKSEVSGTGFIITKDGLILTNKHVVSSVGTTYKVFTSDGKEYDAEVKATDPLNDIAFIKIDASDLPVIELGDSDILKVGQRAIAIGNALGQYQNSVTTGIISAVGRVVEAGDSLNSSTETLENVIQTDAAINSGNSGGPLINLDGQVIGINTAVDSTGESIGFAIPINLAKSVIDNVITTGKISRPMIGIRYIPVTKELASKYNLSVDYGAYIYSGNSGQDSVINNSPASKAGLKEGDIVTKINDEKIEEGHSLIGILTNHKVGDTVTITYIRDSKEQKTTAVLEEASS